MGYGIGSSAVIELTVPIGCIWILCEPLSGSKSLVALGA